MQPKEIFSATSNALERLADLFILSVLFLVCSVPLITVGASASALYYAVMKNIRGERGGLSGSFLGTFRKNLRQTLALSLLIVVGSALLFVYWLFSSLLPTDSTLYLVYWLVVLVYSVVLYSTVLYATPIAARTQLKGVELISNGFLLAGGNPLKTLLLLALLVVCIVIFSAVPILILMLPATFALLSSYLLEPILDKHTSPEDAALWHEG